MKIEEILAVKHLSVEFQTSDGKKQVVKDVSLSLRQGEVLALVGESGCGKTVLCRSILKLLPKSASVTGEAIQYKDQNLIGYNEKEMQQIRGHGIAMVFQDPQSTLNPTMTVGSQIEEAILLHEKALKQNKKESAKERAIELMKLVGIKDAEQRYDLYPYHFSGGMRQRCVLATALASNPKLLIADEPTTALDVTIQAEILKLLKKLQKELNLSILFITHDLGVVAQIADRVAVMQDGNIVELEEAKQLFTAPKHSYTKKLIHDHPYYMHRNESKLISESELHEKLVEISHLSYFYPLDRKRVFQAVKDVSFEIRRDEIFGLVGESGSGKSTVGKCLMGILNPEAETFSYDGINLLDKKAKKKNARRLQKERQMIFQDSTSSLNQKMKVEKILGGLYRGLQHHGHHCRTEFRAGDLRDAGDLRPDGEKGQDALYDSGGGVCHAVLHGHVQLRRLPGSGKRRVDAAVHRLSGVWRHRGSAAGGHLHAGLPDHLRRTYQLHFSVLFYTFPENLLSGVGVYHYVFLVPRVQSGAEHDPEHFHPHPERHLSSIHCADPAGTESRFVEGEPVRLSHDGGGNRRGQHRFCAGRRGTAAGRSGAAAAQAAAVPAGLRLGLCGGGNAAAQPRGERSAPQGARGGGMRVKMICLLAGRC